MAIVWGILRVIIGGIFGWLSFFALLPAVAALLSDTSPVVVQIAFLVVVGLGALVGFFAASVRRSFGWGFLALGLCTFALPLSTMLLAGRVASQMTTSASTGDQAATLIGAGLGGGLMTGFAAIVGFFLGAIFLIVALVLLLGGRREVILVDRASGAVARGVATSDVALPRGRAGQRIEPPPLN